MGHADQQGLLSVFERVARDHQTTVADFLDNPSLLDIATQRFIPKLNRLRTSWGKRKVTWKYGATVKKAYDLIRSDYGDEIDRSGALLFYHPLQVADNSFRMCKVFGFDDKDATTIWIAALCHDYLERAQNEDDYTKRFKSLKDRFDPHDPDTTNLVVMLTNREKNRPYFAYVERIGSMDGFTLHSTHKAQLGACIIKDNDSGHNSEKSRNLYLDRETAVAEQLINSMDPALREKGALSLEKIGRTKTKIQMYAMNRGLMRAKMKGLLGIEGGIPIESTMVDFLLSDDGIPFRVKSYSSARQTGLGPDENNRYIEKLEQHDQGHDVVFVHLSPSEQTKISIGTTDHLKTPFNGPVTANKDIPPAKGISSIKLHRSTIAEAVQTMLRPQAA